jgi:hypothetical protein
MLPKVVLDLGAGTTRGGEAAVSRALLRWLARWPSMVAGSVASGVQSVRSKADVEA